ncbi:gastrula zinc finger protein XlCGF57.1-like [Folsomia candida]|uniref:gastrula zinc finger protein XlCGF57.1-like n=1 Tax=Folsomia candida TaxID=158441 RepID=UPI0016054E93|nr:gastrula zinc finger protein XlCGF57.1-like [Folsomia candida]
MHKTNNFGSHVVTHGPDAKMKCEVCGKISKNRLALSCHMWNLHSDRKRPSCDTCGRVFANLTNLRRHINTAHGTKERPRLPCTFPGCEKTYLSKQHISEHVKTEHSHNPVRIPCTLCGKEFKTRKELEQHISTHTTEKPFKCATCGRSFAQIGKMKRHEVTHLETSARDVSKWNKEQKIHSCDKCEYRSHSKCNFVEHTRRHKPAKHGCYFCGKRFVAFKDLVRHSSSMHTLESREFG